MKSAPSTTPDAGREAELADLGVTNPEVIWLPEDRVRVTLPRLELDRLIGDLRGRSTYEPCDCEDASIEGYDEGHAAALTEIRALAEAGNGEAA